MLYVFSDKHILGLFLYRSVYVCVCGYKPTETSQVEEETLQGKKRKQDHRIREPEKGLVGKRRTPEGMEVGRRGAEGENPKDQTMYKNMTAKPIALWEKQKQKKTKVLTS